MKVTGFDLKKSTAGKSLAFGRIVLDGVVEIDIQIVEGKNGPFISYPSKQGKDGKWYQQVKIIDRDAAQKIQDQVIYFFEQNVKNLP